MLRTWAVRLLAIELTLSVKSFQVPATPWTISLTAQLAFSADFAGYTGNFGGKAVQLVHHRIDGVL